MYTKECLEIFLKKQTQLFDEPVAENLQEAQEFLEECMAVVVKSKREVRRYFEEVGADVDTMSDQELLDSSEVFELPGGKYLIVEG